MDGRPDGPSGGTSGMVWSDVGSSMVSVVGRWRRRARGSRGTHPLPDVGLPRLLSELAGEDVRSPAPAIGDERRAAVDAVALRGPAGRTLAVPVPGGDGAVVHAQHAEAVLAVALAEVGLRPDRAADHGLEAAGQGRVAVAEEPGYPGHSSDLLVGFLGGGVDA